MDCENCGERKAKITLTEIEDNAMHTLNLCPTCATLKGVSAGSGSAPVADLLAHLGGAAGDTLFDTAGEACEYCGTDGDAFRKSGRLGCPQCYAQFHRQLRALLRRVHGSSEHMGKVYVSTAPEADPQQLRLSTLRRRLERAVEIEDFESAADLRDAIHALTEVS